MNNDLLHAEAVRLLIQRQTTGAAIKSYNARRRAATAALQPVLQKIWGKLENGESVGGYTSKEGWSESQGVSIRQIQRIIRGTAQTRHHVVLKSGMIVKIDGAKVILTRAMLDLLKQPTEQSEMRLAARCAAAGQRIAPHATITVN